MMHLSDGLGQAAKDMLPGSAFLKGLNRRPRAAGDSRITSWPVTAAFSLATGGLRSRAGSTS